MNKVFIDGIKTREQIDVWAGRKNGIRRICEETGFSATVLNDACLSGEMTTFSFKKALERGIPVMLSNKPIPCKRRERKKKIEFAPWDEEIPVSDHHPAQLNFEDVRDLTASEQMRDVIIKHLEAMIEDLRRI